MMETSEGGAAGLAEPYWVTPGSTITVIITIRALVASSPLEHHRFASRAG